MVQTDRKKKQPVMRSSVKVTLSSDVFYTGHCVIYVVSEDSVESTASIFRARDSLFPQKLNIHVPENTVSLKYETPAHSSPRKLRNLTFPVKCLQNS